MMKIKQKHISKHLGISQALVSLILTGKRPISWPLAVKLSEIFPGKSLIQWKQAGPEEIKRAFAQYEEV